MPTTAIALPGVQYSAQWWRQAVVGGTYAHAGNSISVMPGVVVGLEVVGMSGSRVSIGQGIAVVSPSDGVRGSYQVASDEVVTLQLPPADTVYSRLDAIVLRVRDAAWGDSTTGATIEAIAGTPSVSPVAPPTPAGALLLAYAQVPTSGAVAAIDQRLWTSAIGGVMSGTREQRLALPTAHLRPGQSFTENTDAPAASPPGKQGQTWRWNGSEWTPQFVTGFRAYVGYVQREFSFDYTLAIPAGTVYAMPLRRAHGARWDERNNLNCSIINGFNIQVPISGRYRIQYGMTPQAADRDVRFAIAIRTGTVATQLDQGSIGTPAGTIIAEDRSQGSTSRLTEVQQFQLAAGDHISATVWHPETTTRNIYYENPFTSFVDVTRLGD